MMVLRWERVKDLLYEAMRLGPEQRSRFLDGACSGDAELRAEIESLLSAGRGVSSGFLGSLAPLEALKAGRVFAERFQLTRKLGEGGMGQVWLAEQSSPVRRPVALKVIKGGIWDQTRIERFRSEPQSLAMMDHPAIAKVFDAGITPGGQPYLAMEYVPGLPITEYCDRKKLGIREKLELFIHACEGVAHAHEKAIIHRDLKPSNMLVLEVDGRPSPRIIDFGLAKAATPPITPESLTTQPGLPVGTLPYMSPEQALGERLGVDARSDIYSLGVILYQLLSGRLPHDLQRRPLDEALRTVREEEPPCLGSINRNCRGDLEAIVGKALEKDKARRYASAASLASDIQNFLNDEPIAARRPSGSYLFSKFGRRHRAMVASAAAVFFALLAGIAASSWEAVRASRAGAMAHAERDRAVAAQRAAAAAEAKAVEERNRAIREKRRADEEAAAAKAISDFLQNDLLRQASLVEQGSKPDPDIKVRTALDRAADRIPVRFRDKPLVEASIRQAIGTTYLNLGLLNDAEVQMKQSLDLRRRELGDDHLDAAISMNNLAVLYIEEGKTAQAEPLLTKTLQVRRRVLGAENPVTLVTLSNLGSLYRAEGKYRLAERSCLEALEIRKRVLGENHRDTAMSMHNLAALYRLQGRNRAGERLETRALEIWRAVLGEENPVTLRAMDTLAALYDAEERYGEAEGLWAKVLEVRRRLLSPQHPDTIDVIASLARVQLQETRYGLAEPLAREALSNWDKTDSWKKYYGQALLGASLAGQGRLQEGGPMLGSGYLGLVRRQNAIPVENRGLVQQVAGWRELGGGSFR